MMTSSPKCTREITFIRKRYNTILTITGNYKRARNLVVSKIREAKRTFVDEAINQAQTKPKDMWTRLKQFLPSKCNTIQTSYLQIDNTCISQNDQIAHAFNDFFCNIGHNLGKNFDDKLPDVEQLMVLLKYQKCL